MKHYKYNIKYLNMAIKNSHVLRYFHLFNTLGTIGLGLELYTGRYNVMPFVFFNLTIGGVISLYKTTNKITKEDHYYMDNKEEIDSTQLLYDEYLEDIAKIIKKVPFESPIELVHALDKLLTRGAFSNGNSFDYYKHEEIEHEMLGNLLGTFVLEGHGVCRHTTMFMLDLLNKLGIETYSIPCYFEKEDREDIKADHVIVGLSYADSKFAYDFTHHLFGRINDDNNTIKLVDCFGESDIYNLVIDDKLGYFTQRINYPNLRLEKELPKMNHYKVFEKVNYLYNMLMEYNKQNKKREEIVEKTLKLIPRK